MSIQDDFQKFIQKKKLFSQKDKILLALSGGVDSVVMAELFHRCGYRFAVAHCNFQLRGKDANKDEEFVKKLAEKYKVPFYGKRFDTEAFANEQKLSIQEAARELRYSWFLKIKKEKRFQRVATAHHFNDNIETFFINLLRGTGLVGLRGIPALNNERSIVRPLLFALRNEVEVFAKKEKLKFRSDVSNDTDAYLRNRIRHHLVPLLLELNPQFEKTMKRNMENLAFAENIFVQNITAESKKMLKSSGDYFQYDRKKLEKTKHPIEYLTEFLRPYSFNAIQAEDVWNTTTSGKQFFSPQYHATIDRGKILISKNREDYSESILLKKGVSKLQHPFFVLKINVISKNFDIPAAPAVYCLDGNKLKFPLVVRKWQEGDSFFPLGMKHHKKISDFLIDKKVSRPSKEKTFVVVSDKNIVCILGHRIDDRFRVTEKTKKIYQLKYNGL